MFFNFDVFQFYQKRLQLINQIAKKLSIKKIIFATSCTKLTMELLNNVAIGKGAHISQEMVFLWLILNCKLAVARLILFE